MGDNKINPLLFKNDFKYCLDIFDKTSDIKEKIQLILILSNPIIRNGNDILTKILNCKNYEERDVLITAIQYGSDNFYKYITLINEQDIDRRKIFIEVFKNKEIQDNNIVVSITKIRDYKQLILLMHTFFTYKNLANDINFVNRFIELNNIELQFEFIEDYIFKKEKYNDKVVENYRIKEFRNNANFLIMKLTSNSYELNIELIRAYLNPNIRKDKYLFDKILDMNDYLIVEKYNDAFSDDRIRKNSFINQLLLNINEKDRRKILMEVYKNEELQNNKKLLIAISTSASYNDMLLLIHTAIKYPKLFQDNVFLEKFIKFGNVENRLELINKGLRGKIR